MRDFTDPWEPEDVFDRAEAKERRARIDEAKQRNAAVAAREAEQDAARREEARLFTLGTNERFRLAEFRAYGVEPPIINGEQTTTSIHLLFSFGWTIEEVSGKRQMIAPPLVEAKPRKRREDYDQNS